MKKKILVAVLSLACAGLASAADVEKGKAAYVICQACHGAKAEGMEALGAPKLAGQSPWYLVTQIKNFRDGIRGTHEDDTWGQTMAPMAATLATDEDIANVVAYIGTL